MRSARRRRREHAAFRQGNAGSIDGSLAPRRRGLGVDDPRLYAIGGSGVSLVTQAVTIVADILRSGARQGLFRSTLVARDVYLLIAATGYFYTANRHTLTAFLGEPMASPEAVAHWQDFVIETVLRTVRADQPHPETSTHEDITWQKSQPAKSRARSSSAT